MKKILFVIIISICSCNAKKEKIDVALQHELIEADIKENKIENLIKESGAISLDTLMGLYSFQFDDFLKSNNRFYTKRNFFVVDVVKNDTSYIISMENFFDHKMFLKCTKGNMIKIIGNDIRPKIDAEGKTPLIIVEISKITRKLKNEDTDNSIAKSLQSYWVAEGLIVHVIEE